MSELKDYYFDDGQIEFIVNFLRDNAHNPESKGDRDWIQELSNKIENQFVNHSKKEHQAALYDACLAIVNTYNQSEMLDGYDHNGVSPYTFMTFARNILNKIAEAK